MLIVTTPLLRYLPRRRLVCEPLEAREAPDNLIGGAALGASTLLAAATGLHASHTAVTARPEALPPTTATTNPTREPLPASAPLTFTSAAFVASREGNTLSYEEAEPFQDDPFAAPPARRDGARLGRGNAGAIENATAANEGVGTMRTLPEVTGWTAHQAEPAGDEWDFAQFLGGKGFEPSGEPQSSPEGSGGGPLNPLTLPAVSVEAHDDNAAEVDRVPGSFLIARTGDTTGELTVYFTLGGTATHDVDYRSCSGSVTIGAGYTSALVVVDTIDDALDEGAETVTLTLLADAAYDLTPLDDAQISILDDDVESAGNQPPVAGDDEVSTDEDSAVTFAVLTNDADAESATVTVLRTFEPTIGSVVINPNQTLTYTPRENWTGTDTFQYLIGDGQGKADTATVTVTINPVNDAPQTLDDTYGLQWVAEWTNPALNVPVHAGLLRNDYDVDEDTLTVELVGDGPQYGDVWLNADGSFLYMPYPYQPGTDSFLYHVFDGTTYSATTTVYLNIHATNAPPTGVGNDYSLQPNTTLTVGYDELLANDFDLDWDLVTLNLPLSGVSHGTLVQGATGFQYTPDLNYVGDDSFTYTVFDGLNNSLPITVTLSTVNTRPFAADDFYETHANTTLVIDELGVAANDWDEDTPYESPAVELVAGPQHGTLTWDGDGSFAYTPDAGFLGTDTFTYRAVDAVSTSEAMGTVTIDVWNTVPYADDDDFYMPKGNLLLPGEAYVLHNDGDHEDDVLTAELVTGYGPQHATSFELFADGTFLYAPDYQFAGVDSFRYRAFDGASYSEQVEVRINVVDELLTVADHYAADAEFLTNGWVEVSMAQGLLANDVNYLPGAMRAKLVPGAGPQFGTLVVNTDNDGCFDGSFSYLPGANFPGTDTFAYQTVVGAQVANQVTVTLQRLHLVADVKLRAVGFKGDGHRDLVQDQTPAQKYAARDFNQVFRGHWFDSNGDGVAERNYPVTAVSDKKLNVEATFSLPTPAPFLRLPFLRAYKNLNSLWIRGQVGQEVMFLADAEKIKIVTGAQNLLHIESVQSNNKLPAKVDFFSAFNITWQISLNNTVWLTVGTSSNPLYVTLKQPKLYQPASDYHTIYRVGSQAAAGKSDPAEVIAAIWKYFDLSWMKWINTGALSGVATIIYPLLRRADDNAPLTYYHKWLDKPRPDNMGSGPMLKTENPDGMCGHWAFFFTDVLNAQGLTSETTNKSQRILEVLGPRVGNETAWLMVTNWKQVNGAPRFAGIDASFSYVNTPKDQTLKNAFPTVNVATAEYEWLFTQYQDQPGVFGQNNINPPSLFPDHVVVKMQVLVGAQLVDRFYDPSYGLIYTDLAAMQNQAITGYYLNFLKVNEANPLINADLTGDNDKNDVNLRIFKIQPAPKENKLREGTNFGR